MSKQCRNLKRAISAHLGEFLNGYLMIGFEAQSGECFIVSQVPDSKTGLALNNVIASIVEQGGVTVENGDE